MDLIFNYLCRKTYYMAKPFLKWAGGKGQLLNVIGANTPEHIDTYIEPFVGSGAVMFDILEKKPNIQHVIINDVNTDLINTYLTIRDNCNALIDILHDLYQSYISKTIDDRSTMFYEMREKYNKREMDVLNHSALFIFLNRTCFNGLYRVNAKGYFNVPFGKYANPKICDGENLLAVSAVLQNVEILNGDYAVLAEHARAGAFVYLDPPYKPISETSAFNSYVAGGFGDEEQVRLRDFCNTISEQGASFMLSNSDPASVNPENDFFDRIYAGYNIQRVLAKRNINSKGGNRGEINELLITNY